MSAESYADAVRGILAHLDTTQGPAVEQAAELIVHALTHGGAVFCAEIGHGNQMDFLNRAGGLAAVQAFNVSCNINDPVAECLRDRPGGAAEDRELAAVRFAVQHSNLRAGDVLLLGSVSGKNSRPVELALACLERGVKTIGFTAMPYTAQVSSLHPSGKKLCEVVDVVIDQGAPFGDAAVAIPGIPVDVCPVSGVASLIAGWMIWERVMRRMAAAGDPPSVFMSFNRPGGQEFYDASKATYQQRGY